MPETTTQHGVLVNVLNTGVVILGESSVGKSELALGLIDRGHKFIADDIIEIRREDDRLMGSCPPILQDFLEIRGIGILNVAKLFSSAVIQKESEIDLTVEFKNYDDQSLPGIDRIHGEHSEVDWLGIKIPKVTIPIAPGRNLAILLEAAVRNQQLKNFGYDATTAFLQRQKEKMQENS